MTYLDKVKTVCPQCKTPLIVKNADRVASKQVKCPSCGQRLAVKFPVDKSAEPEEKEAVQEQPKTIDGSFLSSKPHSHSLHTPAGELRKLVEGVNTVGRASPNSNATIQLHVNDAYMSRNSAKIELRRLPTGQERVTLSYWESKNPILVNNNPLDLYDVVVLHHADRITLGRTIIVYEVAE